LRFCFAFSGVNERYREWLLKNSSLVGTAEILGLENVYQNRDRRLSGFLLQSFFDLFLLSEFFNSHEMLRQLPTQLRL